VDSTELKYTRPEMAKTTKPVKVDNILKGFMYYQVLYGL